MIFLRVENEQRMGCYISVPCGKINTFATASTPMPMNDWLLVENAYRRNLEVECNSHSPSYRYGFNSLEQFQQWFEDSPETLEVLEHEKYFLSIYNVPKTEVIEGTTQCILLANHHIPENRVKTISLIDGFTTPSLSLATV